jgi:hypothetical protein
MSTKVAFQQILLTGVHGRNGRVEDFGFPVQVWGMSNRRHKLGKLRSDSAWSRLTPDQREQVDKWLFIFNVSYRGALALAEQQFGLKSSLGSIARYHRRRQAEREALGIRVQSTEWGGSTEVRLTKEALQQETMRAVALAAHKLAQAKPEQLKVRELRGLVKLLLEERRLVQGREATVRKVNLAQIMGFAKVAKDTAKARSTADWKKLFGEAAEILQSLEPETGKKNSVNEAKI